MASQTGNVSPEGGRVVLNIGRLGSDGGAYYLSTVAAGAEEYYLGAGEAPGRWVGRGTAALGLAGQVTREELGAVLAGRHPRDGHGVRASNRSVTVPGFDLTFRAPKSVSLLWAMSEEDVAGTVRSAHDAAVLDALTYLERNALRTRVGRERRFVAVDGAVAATFRHRTSREGDPLLHTHCLVANLARTAEDGRWRTLDSRSIYRHSKTAGYLYQASLRHRLTAELGVGWQPVVNGCADLAGVERLVIEHFSRRRSRILRAMASYGATSAKVAQVATLTSRKAKDRDINAVELRQTWQRVGDAVGFGPVEARRLLWQETRHWLDGVAPGAVQEELAGPQGLTKSRSTFTRRDVIQAWCARLPRGAPVGTIEQMADLSLASDHVAIKLTEVGRHGAATGADRVMVAVAKAVGHEAALSPSLRAGVSTLLADSALSAERVAEGLLGESLAGVREPGAVLQWRLRRLATVNGVHLGNTSVERQHTLPADPTEARFTTPELLAVEEQALRLAASARPVSGCPPIIAASVLADRGLAPEQDDMVRRLLTDDAAVQVVVGPAGSGKTKAIVAAVEGWHQDGRHVVGTALAARTAQMLGQVAGIPSATLHQLSADLQQTPLQPGSVVVLDEAGMVGTRTLHQLLRHSTRAGAKLVLIGDHRQLPEIDAGGLFRELAETTDAIHLTTNRRQRDPAERAAVDALRVGDRVAAVDHFAARAMTCSTIEEAAAAAVAAWWADRQAGRDTLLLAATNAHVELLNQHARAARGSAGQLHGPSHRFGDRNYQVGDEVLCLRNNRRLDVLNGTTGTITTLDGERVEIATDRGPRCLPFDYASAHLTRAYAMTVHKAQGQTVDTTHVLLADDAYREMAYVMLSRHRDVTAIYEACEGGPHLAQSLERERAQRTAGQTAGRATRKVVGPEVER